MTAQHTVHVNRAPVVTRWAAVVAERLGYGCLSRWPGAAAGSRLISGAGAIPEGPDPPYHRTRGRHGRPRSAG